MRGTPTFILALLLAATGCTANAQVVSLPPAATARCLTAAADSPQPVYPVEFLRRETGGWVVVELTFTDPGKGPEIQFQTRGGKREFEQAVRQRVEKLRVPCLDAADGPAKLAQEYAFKPTGPVRWTSRDPDDAFKAPDKPPQIEMHGPTSLKILKRAARAWSEDDRLPCQDGAPLQLRTVFTFRMQDEPFYGFKDLDFVHFLRASKDIDKQTLKFETRAMDCPFEVLLTYLQPYLPNQVHKSEPAEGARGPLLNWLTSAELTIPESAHPAVFGDVIIFTVPCIEIDLKPRS